MRNTPTLIHGRATAERSASVAAGTKTGVHP